MQSKQKTARDKKPISELAVWFPVVGDLPSLRSTSADVWEAVENHTDLSDNLTGIYILLGCKTIDIRKGLKKEKEWKVW